MQDIYKYVDRTDINRGWSSSIERMLSSRQTTRLVTGATSLGLQDRSHRQPRRRNI